jgi:cystathionine beta-lyase/cystathionine gamma-synthase
MRAWPFRPRSGLQQAGGINSMRDFGVPPRLVRLHIGLEDIEDLWADLQQALTASATTEKGR